MARMLRKQIYVQKHQQVFLRRLAKERGVSEAELIRDALDRHLGMSAPRPFIPDPAAWEEILRLVESRRALASTGKPYRWRREDAYEERMSRFDRSGH